jgi:16S rRNA (cytidine1402-2'-O)-methyltransferase
MPGTLYMVATPIGNLQDISQRALDILRSVDLIACEDTRVTSKLLTAYGISKPLFSLHEHSKPSTLTELVRRIEVEGKNVGYACDAGTPNMNDPGGKLAQVAHEHGIKLIPIPGPSALTAAISVCGFDLQEFRYLGFVPNKKGRQTMFKKIAEDRQPSIFLESTHRIDKTMEQISEFLDPNRPIFVGRELTKLHETLYRGTCAEVIAKLKTTSTKGEFIIIVGPQPKR